MSCCVCRLPLLPDRAESTSPLPEHFAPPGVLTKEQTRYFERGTLWGDHIHGFWVDTRYFSSNMIANRDPKNNPVGLMMFLWEQEFITMHHTCFRLLCVVLDAEGENKESLRKLVALEMVLGPPGGGIDCGRWPGVNYEGAGEEVDTRTLWKLGFALGSNIFDWRGLARLGYDWVVHRPDVFPRFYTTVSPERVKHLASGTDLRGTDVLTRMPSDVLRAIASHLVLEPAALAQLSGTCRFLRFLAVDEWQLLARDCVLALRWAIPCAAELQQDAKKLEGTANKDAQGDWMLYLSHVHRTNSMRVRRWVWALCGEVKRVADKHFKRTRIMEKGTMRWQEAEKMTAVKWVEHLWISALQGTTLQDLRKVARQNGVKTAFA
ncbi:hypothetical protein EXIGLDRAFT_770627 [Exidia glandulosa HHB12029]|uniref:F-box domain-containing protein n=1 Tax=Exidia glandulosa HHB12029 TaxID=1314781 RepID=A0A165GKL5_EXIGL|nr:hypothetical protein EXIGLDRAFT_770627 [Exidia glandulosa HHB12029]